MKDEQVIEMRVSDEARKQVMNRITRAHVKGLDIDKAQELGVFQRMSLLLCGMHSLNAAAYRVFGGVEYLLGLLGADKKHEIRVACNQFQIAFDNYMQFWSRYYSNNGDAVKEMNGEVEELYHQFMKWAQLPESWALGEPQNLPDDTDIMLQITEEGNDKVLRFHKSNLKADVVGDIKESWMVTKYNRSKRQQVSVEEGLDKASSMMIAKRFSAEDPENIYTASCVREYTQEIMEVLPMKAFKGNKTIGSVRKVFKND